jgi:exopolysaccharide biosynthesis polyprenyl glycosylphosphotransferase
MLQHEIPSPSEDDAPVQLRPRLMRTVPPDATAAVTTPRSFSASSTDTQALPVTVRWRNHAPRRFWALLTLVAFDAVWINLAFFASYAIRFILLRGVTFAGATVFVQPDLTTLRVFQLALTIGMLTVLLVRGMYRQRPTVGIFRQAGQLFIASTICFAAFSMYEFFFRSTHYELVQNTRALVVLAWLAAMAAPLAGRVALGMIMRTLYRLGWFCTPVLVAGSSRAGKVLMQHLAAMPGLGYSVLGFVRGPEEPRVDFGRFKLLGTLDDCEALLRDEHVGEVIIALPSAQSQRIRQVIALCERRGIPFRLVPDMHDLSLARVDLEAIEGIPTLTVQHPAARGWQRAIKRGMDIIGAFLLIALGLPLWVLIALAIRLETRGPALFRQTRIGQNGQPFTAFKFRSMTLHAEEHVHDLGDGNIGGRGLFKLRQDPRCTRVGRLLRRASLDEIPQLINVLRGEMALVGPRPPLPREVARYQPWERRRLEMPPGMTGLWQVRGRSDIGFDEMVLMDLFYIEHWSLRLDCEILLRTLPVVLLGRGAY